MQPKPFKLDRAMFIPKEEGVRKIENAQDGIVAYAYEATTVRGTLRFYSMIFTGTKAKPDSHVYAMTAEARDADIARAFEAAKSRRERKDAQKAQDRLARQMGHGLEVGDLLAATWGYEQTNVELWRVMAVRGSYVDIQRVVCDRKSRGFMSEELRPTKETYGEIVSKKVSVDRYGVSVKMGCFELTKEAETRTWIETSYA